MLYQARRAATREVREVRGLRFQMYRWEGSDPAPVLMVHGWGDSGATFQFVADHLPRRTLIAFDARGFGHTEWPQDGYWFPDYLADLDAVLDQLSPDHPVDLLGHSMGGNVAMLYAGIRPHRVRRLMNLEGFGLRRTSPEQAPDRYREWLDEIKRGSQFAVYQSFEQLITVLARRNPHTSAEHLEFIAHAWARQDQDGRVRLRADPRHKRVNAVLYQREQAQACFKRIAAPLMLVMGEQSLLAKEMAAELGDTALHQLFPNLSIERIADGGHMLHHEQPAAIAALMARFFSGTAA
jgi:pimeloyl-ACP methyl ester carboxylesterase